VRMAADSKPEALDEIDRRLVQLKIEREALKKESDSASKQRLEKLEDEIADLEGQSDDMTARWKSEQAKVGQGAQRRATLDRQLAEAEAAEKPAEGPLTPEVVDAEQIAAVVSRWTGVPVDKMLEGEREKLLKMEDELGRRVVGQDEALEAVSDAVRRARAG